MTKLHLFVVAGAAVRLDYRHTVGSDPEDQVLQRRSDRPRSVEESFDLRIAFAAVLWERSVAGRTARQYTLYCKVIK